MTIKRILLSLLCMILATAVCGRSFAFTIVAVKSKDLPPYDEALKGFKAGLQGKERKLTVIGEAKDAAVTSARIMEEKPDLIFCAGAEALEVAAEIKGIPKVFTMVARSNAEAFAGRGDIYGVTIDLPCSQQLEIISEALPGRKRVGVLYDPAVNLRTIGVAKLQAEAMGFELIAQPVRSIKDVPAALDSLKDRIDVLLAIFDRTAYGPETARYVLLNTLGRNIPLVGFSTQFAKAGALIAVYSDFDDMGRQAGQLAGRILNHEATPQAIVDPCTIRIAVNRKVANAMRIAFPPGFLEKVHELF